MFNYPTTLDATSAFTSLAKALRDGTLTSNAVQSAQDAWVVQGFGQAQLIGSPKSAFTAAAFTPASSVDFHAFAAELEIASTHVGDPAAFAAGPVDKVNWPNMIKNLLAILQVVLPLIA